MRMVATFLKRMRAETSSSRYSCQKPLQEIRVGKWRISAQFRSSRPARFQTEGAGYDPLPKLTTLNLVFRQLKCRRGISDGIRSGYLHKITIGSLNYVPIRLLDLWRQKMGKPSKTQ